MALAKAGDLEQGKFDGIAVEQPDAVLVEPKTAGAVDAPGKWLTTAEDSCDDKLLVVNACCCGPSAERHLSVPALIDASKGRRPHADAAQISRTGSLCGIRSRRRRDSKETSRGAAAAGSWRFEGDESRGRRGQELEI